LITTSFIFFPNINSIMKLINWMKKIFKISSSQRWASQRFSDSSQDKSRAKIDRLGSHMTNENWKRVSIYMNPFFISRHIYSAEIVLGVGYVFFLHFQIKKEKLKCIKDFYAIYFLTWLGLLFQCQSQVKSSHFQKNSSQVIPNSKKLQV
jgi:hypothetical protein